MSSINRVGLTELSALFPEPFDLLVCCASFESRSTSIPSAVEKLVNHVMMVRNIDFLPYIRTNADHIEGLFGDRIEKVDVSSNNSLQSAEYLVAALERYKSKGVTSILIDITTFTHEFLLILFAILKLDSFRDWSRNAKYVYLGAEKYSGSIEPTEPEPSHHWLSKGCKEVRSVLGYPGEISPFRSLHLIVMVGFETERALSLIRQFEPAEVSIGFGALNESISQKHFLANSKYKDLVKREQLTGGRRVREFEFSCRDPFACCSALEREINYGTMANKVIAPINNKISTIGAALVALAFPRVQLCYAQPDVYNFLHYSSPGNECYLFEVNY